jgi:hypothetical protein
MEVLGQFISQRSIDAPQLIHIQMLISSSKALVKKFKIRYVLPVVFINGKSFFEGKERFQAISTEFLRRVH